MAAAGYPCPRFLLPDTRAKAALRMEAEVGGEMFYCERCGTGFNAGAASSASSCPRCRSKDGVDSPLRFRLFDPATLPAAGIEPIRDLERMRKVGEAEANRSAES
jgi:hypothetical protein